MEGYHHRCTYRVLREDRNVIKRDLVRIARIIQILLLTVGDDTTDDLCFGIFELRMSSEFLSLFSVGEVVSHIRGALSQRTFK